MSDGGNELLGAVASSLTTDAIFVLDASTMRFVEVNLAFTQIFGYSQDEARRLQLADFVVTKSPSIELIQTQVESRGSVDAGVRVYRCKDGRQLRMATRISVTVVVGKRYYCSVMRDQSDIERAQQSAVENERRFRTLADAAFEGIGITEQGVVVDCNEQLGRFLGLTVSETIGKRVLDFIAPESRDQLIERFKRGAGEPFEHIMLRADGTRFHAESQAKTLQLGERTIRVTALRDISARKNQEAQRQQSQRLESVGRLAGGIAHDFNNLLTVVLSLVEMLLERPRDPEEQDDLKQVRAAGERASELTQQLLAFARRRIVEPKVVSLTQLVTDLDKMLRRLLGEHISLATLCAPDLGAVRVDPGQIEQVVVNLAINARDAMEPGGTLTIETSNVSLGPEYAATHPEVTPGDYVMLAVSDTGSGMDQATLEHIFEPFFTTKSERGTGLGLATCYGIVRQSGGSLWVYSEVGHGTTFKIYLPRVHDPLDKREPTKTARTQRGVERILLVEDDPMVRPMVARSLRHYGYEVHDAATPSEARAMFARLAGKIDILVTDVVLPEMNGRQLAESLCQQQPGLRVLYTSGYTENTILHQGVVDTGIHFLAKPYRIADLAQRVRSILDGKGQKGRKVPDR